MLDTKVVEFIGGPHDGNRIVLEIPLISWRYEDNSYYVEDLDWNPNSGFIYFIFSGYSV